MLDQHLYLIDTLKSFCVKINLSFLNDSIFIYVLPYIQTLFMDIYILFSLGSLLFPGMGPKLRGQEGCLEQCSKRNANHIQKTVTGKLNLRRHVLWIHNSIYCQLWACHMTFNVLRYIPSITFLSLYHERKLKDVKFCQIFLSLLVMISRSLLLLVD